MFKRVGFLAFVLAALASQPGVAKPPARGSCVDALTNIEHGDPVSVCTLEAQGGNAQAQATLGAMYYKGKGVQKDLVAAFKWSLKAAQNGNAAGQYEVSVQYMNGEGTAVNSYHAVAWLKRSAQQGFAPAQLWLGSMYRRGENVAQDLNESARLFALAADQGDAEAQYRAGLAFANTNAQRAFGYFLKAAEQGNLEAQYFVAADYLGGEGVPRNEHKAAEWGIKAAEKGNASAQEFMGVAYENGFGVPMNLRLARYWYELATKNGDKSAPQELQRLAQKESTLESTNAMSSSRSAEDPTQWDQAIYKSDSPADGGILRNCFYESVNRFRFSTRSRGICPPFVEVDPIHGTVRPSK